MECPNLKDMFSVNDFISNLILIRAMLTMPNFMPQFIPAKLNTYLKVNISVSVFVASGEGMKLSHGTYQPGAESSLIQQREATFCCLYIPYGL